jgi:hypothetical protein
MKAFLSKLVLFAILLFLIATSNIFSQETLIQTRHQNIQKKHQKNTSAFPDTLNLPFIDDFARDVGFPDDRFWQDNFAYINYQLPVNSISIGAATLDAIDETGEIYGLNNSNVFGADYLTSNPINLNYNPEDSVYLSFYYQPGGNGDTPEPKDSLVVQFYNVTDSLWESVWQISYNREDSVIQENNLIQDKTIIHETDSFAYKKFRQTLIPVLKEGYLKKGFQFRFHNYVSTSPPQKIPSKSGNVDHWNIDFVRLDEGRYSTDTIINDVAFIKPLQPLLNNYESLPWPHFPEANAYEMKDSLSITYRNIGNKTWNISREFEIIDRMWNNPTYEFTGGTGDDVPPYTVETYPRTINYIFPYNNRDSALFEIKSYLITDVSPERAPYRWNDTIQYLQKFYNYYAYDDGTAENGYGITGQGSQNTRVAFRFHTYKPDTLQAIQIYFNQTLDSANKNYFELYIWDNQNGKPGNVIYTQEGYRPTFEDSVNQFHNYALKEKIYVEGTFFIGYEKFNNEMLNIGFDVNRVNNDKLYYNLDGTWNQSGIKGTLMMRPVFGKYIPYTLSNEEPQKQEKSIHWNLYPNPARDFINIDIGNEYYSDYSFSIYTLQGRLVKESPYLQRRISLSDLSRGIYIIQLHNKMNDNSMRKKIIITR